MRASWNRIQSINYGIIAILFIGIVWISSLSTNTQQPDWDEQRIGFGVSTKADAVYWANQLNATWYLDWKTTPKPSKNSPEYWQMIRLSTEGFHPTRQEIINLLINYPGQVWIIGNEPDNIWQDNLKAESYAAYYHDLYYLIKTVDPSARVAVGAVSQPTPLRLEYLDSVLQEYHKLFHHTLPCDWWTLHAYILREENNSWGAGIPPGFLPPKSTKYEIEQHADIAIFAANIIQFRAWMADNGYANTPLAITEFGVLLPAEFGFTPEKVSAFLEQSFTWLYNQRDEKIGFPKDDFHLVQKFAWFSLGDKIFPVADLVNFSTYTLTPIGITFRDTAKQLSH